MWATRINLKKIGNVERASKICEDISKKDKTFKFKIEGKVLTIISEDKDKAYKRGMIFVKKYLKGMNVGFDVEEMK
ncbi:MAG: hypothetical protein QW734_06540 [Candidatus Bathyarchaeia archaeon]